MNLVDVIDPDYGLQQNKWSLDKPRFGKDKQLEVIGWSGKSGSAKFYIVFCEVCAKDPELFGEGFFRIGKSTLLRGWISCGCGINTKWTEEQYSIRCRRKAEELGYRFLGWAEDFCGKKTKTSMFCDVHGKWRTGIIQTLTTMDQGCPECKYDIVSASRTKPNDTMIESFLSSGQFPSGTNFSRSDRENGQGYKCYWYVECPECQYTGEGVSTNLQRGMRPCLCSPARQKECYINWVIDSDENVVALKFGIANKTGHRVAKQNRHSIYDVRNYVIYEFRDKSSCMEAERECKAILECGVLTKEEMPDGYTETTSVLNLEIIERIYEKYGGVRLDE